MVVSLGVGMRAAVGGVVMMTAASGAMAQSGSIFVDAKSNIFGYGVSTPAPVGGGGGLVAVTIALTPGTGRVLSFEASGGAWWSGAGSSNGPDGGNFNTSTNISAVGPISGYAAVRSGHLVGLLLEAGDPSGLAAPAGIVYSDAASLELASYSPEIRQVFFMGDGLVGTGNGSRQTFNIPDSATTLVLGIADGFSFSGEAGYYDDNTGGYTVRYDVVPSPGTLGLLGLSGLVVARRKR